MLPPDAMPSLKQPQPNDKGKALQTKNQRILMDRYVAK
jgi:hypothetical protein